MSFIGSNDEKADSIASVSQPDQSVRQDVTLQPAEAIRAMEDEVPNFSFDDSDRQLFNHCLSTAVMSARNRPHASTWSERVSSRSVSRESSQLDTPSPEKIDAPDLETLADMLKSPILTQSLTLKNQQQNARRFWVFCVLGVLVRFVLSTAKGTEFVQVLTTSNICAYAIWLLIRFDILIKYFSYFHRRYSIRLLPLK